MTVISVLYTAERAYGIRHALKLQLFVWNTFNAERSKGNIQAFNTQNITIGVVTRARHQMMNTRNILSLSVQPVSTAGIRTLHISTGFSFVLAVFVAVLLLQRGLRVSDSIYIITIS